LRIEEECNESTRPLGDYPDPFLVFEHNRGHVVLNVKAKGDSFVEKQCSNHDVNNATAKDIMEKFISRSEINMLIASMLQTGITSRELILSGNTEDSLSLPLPLRMSIRRSHFYFEIGHYWGNYTVEFFPSHKPATPSKRLHKDFNSIIDEVAGWATRVARELNEPDPWSVLGKGILPEPELLNKREESQKFNDRELRAIKASIQEIRRFLVTEMKPDSQHLKAIDERLSFLEEETKKQNKKQWTYLAIGLVVTIADGLAMSPDQAHKLFALLSDLFKHLFLKLLP
jgi:hypothetical protein